MVSKLFDLIVERLKAKSYWPLIEPVLTLLALYVVTVAIAYQYIQWRYLFTPEVGTFVHSYVVKQISVVFLALTLLALVLGTNWKSSVRTEIGSRLTGWFRSGIRKLVIAGVIVVIAGG